MSLVFNPLGPPFDYVGTSAAPVKYNTTFTPVSFTLNSGLYEYTVTAATHAAGNRPVCQVFELVSGDYELVQAVVIVNASGDVTIQVTSSPDLRFTGRIVIL